MLKLRDLMMLVPPALMMLLLSQAVLGAPVSDEEIMLRVLRNSLLSPQYARLARSESTTMEEFMDKMSRIEKKEQYDNGLIMRHNLMSDFSRHHLAGKHVYDVNGPGRRK